MSVGFYTVIVHSTFSHVLTSVSEVNLELCVKELRVSFFTRGNFLLVFMENAREPSPLSTEKEAAVGYICLLPVLAGKLT